MIEIDGSYGESGGQILRTSCAFSAVTGKAVKIINIRKGRPNPGLQAQHIAAIEALAQLSNAKVIGLKQGSAELIFEPCEIKGGKVEVNIPTAGSVSLVLQGLMIAALYAKDTVNIHINGGATNGKWAPPVLYIQNVLLPILRKINYSADIKIEKYGYYPKGGAQVSMKITPSKLKPLIIEEKGKLISIEGISHASLHLKDKKVAERQNVSAAKTLAVLHKTNIQAGYFDTLNPGSALDCWAVYDNTILGANALGELKKKAEDVGKEAAEELIKQTNNGGAVDEHAEDQLLPYMALAGPSGTSVIKVGHLTKHTETNIWTIEQFLPVKFDIKDKTITCRSA